MIEAMLETWTTHVAYLQTRTILSLVVGLTTWLGLAVGACVALWRAKDEDGDVWDAPMGVWMLIAAILAGFISLAAAGMSMEILGASMPEAEAVRRLLCR